MNWHRLILTVGTKLPIATVGPPITLMIDDIFAPTTLGRDPPRLVLGEQLGRRSPAELTFEINVSELLAVVVAQASCCSTDRLRWLCARCRRKCCAAAWLSYRERNRPPCVAACSWRVLIGKCGPTESTPGVCSPLNARRDRARRRRHRCPRQTRAAGSDARAFSSCRQATLRSVKPFAQGLGITVGRQF